MTLTEIATMVNGIGLPNRYDHFTDSPAPPYIVFYVPAESDFMADDSNYTNRVQLHIELYTKGKDITNESAVEDALRANGITWYKQTDFLSDELIYQTVYECEVILNGE